MLIKHWSQLHIVISFSFWLAQALEENFLLIQKIPKFQHYQNPKTQLFPQLHYISVIPLITLILLISNLGFSALSYISLWNLSFQNSLVEHLQMLTWLCLWRDRVSFPRSQFRTKLVFKHFKPLPDGTCLFASNWELTKSGHLRLSLTSLNPSSGGLKNELEMLSYCPLQPKTT